MRRSSILVPLVVGFGVVGCAVDIGPANPVAGSEATEPSEKTPSGAATASADAPKNWTLLFYGKTNSARCDGESAISGAARMHKDAKTKIKHRIIFVGSKLKTALKAIPTRSASEETRSAL